MVTVSDVRKFKITINRSLRKPNHRDLFQVHSHAKQRKHEDAYNS